MIDIATISSGLHLAADGIWYSNQENQGISYPPKGNEDLYQIEDHSFWFRHRNACIVSTMKTFPPEENGAIFDIGGGNGFVSAGLAEAGFDVVLVEPGRTGVANAKQRGLRNIICATADSAKFNAHSLPAVGLFDVLEHINDDRTYLQSLKVLLKKSGYLYLTVPAYPLLWSAEDVTAGHFRRYTLSGITATLSSAGFKVKFASCIFRFLPLPIFLIRAIPFRLGFYRSGVGTKGTSRQHTVKSGVTSALLDAILKAEIANLSKEKSMHFGASCIVVAINS